MFSLLYYIEYTFPLHAMKYHYPKVRNFGGQSIVFFASRPMGQKPPQNSGQKPPREKHWKPMDVISEIGNHGGFHKTSIFQRVNPVNPEI